MRIRSIGVPPAAGAGQVMAAMAVPPRARGRGPVHACGLGAAALGLLLLPVLGPAAIAGAAPGAAAEAVPDAAADAIESPARIVAAARTAAAAHVGVTDGADIDVRAPDPRLRLPACPAAPAARVVPGTRSAGQFAVEVRCAAPSWRYYASVRVARNEPVAVAARPLARLQVITAADVTLLPREVAALPGGYFSNATDVVGRIAQRPIGAGELLQPESVRSAAVVRRGQTVTLLARSGGLTVRSSGVALADASLAERVRVRNAASNRQVEGVVRSPGTVEVSLE